MKVLKMFIGCLLSSRLQDRCRAERFYTTGIRSAHDFPLSCRVFGCYTSGVTDQQIVDLFAKAAKPRLMDLLKLKIRHIYETTPGDANSKIVIDGCEVQFKSIRSAQPYKDMERFVAEDKMIGFVVNPGLLPIVKAISMDVRGRKMLVTRRIQAREDDKGVEAQLDYFGIRIMMSFDSVRSETQVVWEALYGVA